CPSATCWERGTERGRRGSALRGALLGVGRERVVGRRLQPVTPPASFLGVLSAEGGGRGGHHLAGGRLLQLDLEDDGADLDLVALRQRALGLEELSVDQGAVGAAQV